MNVSVPVFWMGFAEVRVATWVRKNSSKQERQVKVNMVLITWWSVCSFQVKQMHAWTSPAGTPRGWCAWLAHVLADSFLQESIHSVFVEIFQAGNFSLCFLVFESIWKISGGDRPPNTPGNKEMRRMATGGLNRSDTVSQASALKKLWLPFANPGCDCGKLFFFWFVLIKRFKMAEATLSSPVQTPQQVGVWAPMFSFCCHGPGRPLRVLWLEIALLKSSWPSRCWKACLAGSLA